MTIPGMTPVTGMATFALLGLCIGSFLNVCISRWPAGLSIVSPRSRCPNCERPISALENIPLVSWIILRAKCRGCGLPISIGYPAVELLVGLIWLWCAYRFGATFTGLRVAAFASFLVGVAITDAKHYVIPDGFTIAGLVWVLATAVAMIFIDSAHAFDSPFAGLYDGLIGACAGAGAISIIGWLGEVSLKKEAMGFGDVTLMAFVGAALGPGRSLLTIFIAAALGSLVFVLIVFPITKIRSAKTNQAHAWPLVPFGVFLAPAALLGLLCGNDMIAWYLDYTGL